MLRRRAYFRWYRDDNSVSPIRDRSNLGANKIARGFESASRGEASFRCRLVSRTPGYSDYWVDGDALDWDRL